MVDATSDGGGKPSPEGGGDTGTGMPDAGADADADAGCTCTATPPSTARCVGTRCRIQLATSAHPTSIGVDPNFVYWSDDDGSIRRVAKNGGTPTTLVSGVAGPQAIAVDGSNVYFAALGAADGGVVGQTPLDGGTTITLATGQDTPNAIAVDSTHVYFTDYGQTTPGGGSVMKVAIGGGSAAVPIATAVGGPRGIAVDSTNAYWTDFIGNTVASAPLGGVDGGGTILVSGQAGPLSIVVDSVNVYWTNLDGQTIMGAPIAGGGGDFGVYGTSLSQSLYGLARFGGDLYFADDSNNGSVMKIGASGQGETLLSFGEQGPQVLTADASGVYWIDSLTGEVCELTPN